MKKTVFFIGCILVLSAPLSAEEKGKWQEKMGALAETMGELLPELVSENSDLKTLEKGSKALSELSHKLQEGTKSGKMMPPSDDDPSLMFIAGRFSEDSKFAYMAVKRGQIDYAKNYLRTITSYCIACHTRHESGPQFPTFPLNPKTEKLNQSEKAELYIATRQFDKGLAEYQNLIKNEEFAKQQPFQWQKPLRRALAVAVRVKNDPKLAAEIIDSALGMKNLPEFQRANLVSWKSAVETWKKEPRMERYLESGIFSQLKKMMRAARGGQTFRLDHSTEIEYLRASSLAHDLLRIAKNPKIKAEALFSIGMANEVIENPMFWTMHDLWYEGCIRQLPHSSLAERCYQRLEESIYFGYSGSSGTHIPEEVQKLLQEMKILALTSHP